MIDYLIIKESNNGSLCLNKNGDFIEDKRKPIELLKDMCLDYGSTFKGRIDAFCKLTNAKQKPAVLISDSSQLIYFPTESYLNNSCVWVNYNEILRVSSLGNLKSEIVFQSLQKINVDVDSRVIKKQIDRCDLFLSKLHQSLFSQEETMTKTTLLQNLRKL